MNKYCTLRHSLLLYTAHVITLKILLAPLMHIAGKGEWLADVQQTMANYVLLLLSTHALSVYWVVNVPDGEASNELLAIVKKVQVPDDY